MKTKKLLLITSFFFLLLFIFCVTASAQQYTDSVETTRIVPCMYGEEYYSCTFTQRLAFDYSPGNETITIYYHYNDGIRLDYQRPFFWDVIPWHFKWFENYAVAYNFTQFTADYPVEHPWYDDPWGGRNSTVINFDLPGNVHSAEIRSHWGANGTMPNFYSFTLTYGP